MPEGRAAPGFRASDVHGDVVREGHRRASLAGVVGRRVLGGPPATGRCSRRAGPGAAAPTPAASVAAVASAPSLLNPSRLMRARSAGRRWTRGRGLPGWPRAATVPISAKPKPRARQAGTAGAACRSRRRARRGWGSAARRAAAPAGRRRPGARAGAPSPAPPGSAATARARARALDRGGRGGAGGGCVHAATVLLTRSGLVHPLSLRSNRTREPLRFPRGSCDVNPSADHDHRTRPPMARRSSLVCLAQFMVVLDATVVNVALPSIQADLDFSGQILQWVVNAYTLAFGGFLLLGGRAADLFGRRRLFVAGVVVFTRRLAAQRPRRPRRHADRRARAAGPRRARWSRPPRSRS